MDRDSEFRAWNVFRRLREEALCCALPVDTPIPPFLLTGEWRFAFCFTDGDPPIDGFSPAAAGIGVSYNGFYLFSVFGSGSVSDESGNASAIQPDDTALDLQAGADKPKAKALWIR